MLSIHQLVLLSVLNDELYDELVDGLTGLVPAHLP